MARSVALALPFLILGWVLGWLPACTTAEQFACNADAQCVVDGAAGRCEQAGVCSFPDETCPSGHRYGALAGELSGECVGEASSSSAEADVGMTSIVPEGSADASDTGPTSTSTTSMTSTTSGSTGPEPESTGEEPNPYGACSDDSECLDGLCIVELAVCTWPCVRDNECPPAPGMGLSIECAVLPNGELGCAITCSSDEECAAGMVCLSSLCGWP